MPERKLASVQKIRRIQSIENADSLELATVNSWKVVVKKDEFREGDLAIYCEIDSFLPIREEFEFLRKSSFRKMGEEEGFRLKTIRLRGQLSQGLLLPLSILNSKSNPEMQIGISQQPWGDQLQLGPYDDALVIEEGVDLTDLLGIKKFEAPIPACLSGLIRGGFPHFVRKTDEERIQNLTLQYGSFKEQSYFVTEKLDGSSATFYYKDGEFGVCSRNLDLLETPDNSFWKVARHLMLQEKLELAKENIALQGELIGEGIQGNPYKLKGQTVKIFSVYNIDSQEFLNLNQMRDLLQKINSIGSTLEMVPVIFEDFKLQDSIDELLKLAEGKSQLNRDIEREGLVFRNHNKSVSFKAISNKFLLQEN